MDVRKWTAVLLGLASVVSVGCSQPCSWCNGGATTYPTAVPTDGACLFAAVRGAGLWCASGRPAGRRRALDDPAADDDPRPAAVVEIARPRARA